MWTCMATWASRGFMLDSAGLGLLRMDCDWQRDACWSTSLDVVMDRGQRLMLMDPAACTKHLAMPFVHDPHKLRPAGATRFRYVKLMLLVADVEAQLHQNLSSFDVLKIVDQFAETSEKNWLKVAGDDKGYVLEAAVRRRGSAEGELALEFGCFVGYTTIRLGELYRRVGFNDRGPCVVSLERDAVHVNVARHLLDLARLRPLAEAHVGLLPLVSPRTAEEFGWRAVGFAFMDHKGTRFHEDFAELAALGLPAPAGEVLADNTLNPGSPCLLWNLTRGGLPFTIALWSLCEFAHTPPVEDWQCLSDAIGRPNSPALAWESNRASKPGCLVFVGSSKTVFDQDPCAAECDYLSVDG